MSQFSSDPRIRTAILETKTRDFIDSSLQNHSSSAFSVSAIDMALIESYVIANVSKEIKEYIKSSDKNVDRYIAVRKHLWKIDTPDSGQSKVRTVTRVAEEYRSLFYDLVGYIQGQMDTNRSSGVALYEISEWMYENYKNVRRQLQSRLEGVKLLLEAYPLIFEKISYDPHRVTIHHVRFACRASTVNDAILLPPRFEGTGRVHSFLQNSACGFIIDERTRQNAYFPLTAVQPSSIGSKELQAMMARGQRFKFDAILNEKKKNKWKIIRMYAIEEVPKVKPPTSGSTDQPVPVTGNGGQPTSDDVTRATTPEGRSGNTTADDANQASANQLTSSSDDQRSINDTSIDLINFEEANPISDQSESTASSLSTQQPTNPAESFIDLSKESINPFGDRSTNLVDSPVVGESISPTFWSCSSGSPVTIATSPISEDVQINDDNHRTKITTCNRVYLPPPPGFERHPSATIASNANAQDCLLPPIAMCPSGGARPKTVPYVCMGAPINPTHTSTPATISAVNRATAQVKPTPRKAEKRDAASQTEPIIDDQEMLLRLFRNSPQLKPLVEFARKMFEAK